MNKIVRRKDFKSFILGNKHKKHIEIVYYKNIFDILSISLENNFTTLKRLYDKAL